MRRGRGFTLLELLVVIVIIGMLTALVAPRFFANLGRSEVATARAQVDALAKALEVYRIDNGQFPTSEQGLAALLTRPNDAEKWNGPYLNKALPKDPWGHAYVYRSPGTAGQDFDLISLGKDGKPGGDGDAADIGFR